MCQEETPECRVEKLSPEDVHHPPKRNLARSMAIVATCTTAMILNTSNSTSLSISLPLMGKSIGIQEDQLQWMMSAYSLTSGCLLLFFGRLADVYGRKKGFMIGMLWQTVFALSLGFSRHGSILIILRAFQGMGTAAAIPAALGLLAQYFPTSRARSIAFATFSAGAPVGGALGCMVGGILAQFSKEHWRAPFFLSAGLSALCVLGSIMSFDSDTTSSETDPRVDWVGAVLVTSGLVLIVFVLGQGPTAGWKAPYIIACLIIGLILLGAFISWEYYLEKSASLPDKPKSFWTAPPLMKLTILTRAKGRVAVMLLITFLTWCGFISWVFWAQLYYQDYLKLTPVLTMIRFIPMFVSGCFCNVVFAMVVSKLPLVVFILLGTVSTGLASVLFALNSPSAPYWAFEFPSTIMIVFGVDFTYSAGTLFISNVVFPHEQSLAGGLFQTMAQIGTSFGLAVSTIVFKSVVGTQSALTTDSKDTNASISGYRAAKWTTSAFPLFAGLLAIIFLRKVGIIGNAKITAEDSFHQTSTEKKSDCDPQTPV